MKVWYRVGRHLNYFELNINFDYNKFPIDNHEDRTQKTQRHNDKNGDWRNHAEIVL